MEMLESFFDVGLKGCGRRRIQYMRIDIKLLNFRLLMIACIRIIYEEEIK